MPGPGLPTNIDSTYADDGADASVRLHQQYHDTLHGFANEFDTGTRLAGEVWIHDGSLWIPRGLTSADVSIVTFELTAGGNHTFVLANAGKMIGSLTSDTAAMTWTIPLNSSVAFPVGTAIKVLQRGTGQITIAGAAGVALNALASAYKTPGQNGSVVCVKLFSDTWLVEGGIV